LQWWSSEHQPAPIARNRKETKENLGRLGRNVNHFTAFVLPAMRTCLVRQLLLVAIRTIGKRERFEMVVGAPLIFARMGVTSFWIRHSCSSKLAVCGLYG
jgi:hypothetical protein